MLATTWFHVCYFVVVSFFLVRRFRLEFSKVSSMILFFFQAEDGIRDVAVTGVQTCALPISYAVFCLKKKKTKTANNRARQAAASAGLASPQRPRRTRSPTPARSPAAPLPP